MFFIPGSSKFNFASAVEKKIVDIRTAEEITGELLKHFCGRRDRPILISPISYDLSFLLNAPELFVDPNGKDDDLLDQYLLNEPITDFNDKAEPLEGPKSHPTKSEQPNHNSNDQTRTEDLTNTPVIITDNNKFKKPLNLETNVQYADKCFLMKKLPNMRTCVQRRSLKNPQIAKKKKNNQVKIYKLFKTLLTNKNHLAVSL